MYHIKYVFVYRDLLHQVDDTSCASIVSQFMDEVNCDISLYKL